MNFWRRVWATIESAESFEVQLRLPWWGRLWQAILDYLTTWSEAKVILWAAAIVLLTQVVSIAKNWRRKAKHEAEVRLRLKREMESKGD